MADITKYRALPESMAEIDGSGFPMRVSQIVHLPGRLLGATGSVLERRTEAGTAARCTAVPAVFPHQPQKP